MEPVAINHITITKERFAEGHAAIFSKQRQKMLLSCGIVFCAFGLLFAFLQMRLSAANTLSFIMLLTGIIVIIWARTLEKSEFRRKYSAFCRTYGEHSARTVTCYGNCLLIETGNPEPVQIDYPEIQEHKETAHLYILICKDHTGIMLAKDGFETGSWEDLLSAIEKAKEEAEEALKLMEM